jgi:hypothetical protein
MNRDEALEVARQNALRARRDADADRSAQFARRQERIEVFEERVAAFIAREADAGYPHIGTLTASVWVDEEVRAGVFRRETRRRQVDVEDSAWMIPTVDETVPDAQPEPLYLLADGRFCRLSDGDVAFVAARDLQEHFDRLTRFFRDPASG